MRRTFPITSLGDSGYTRLLYAILKPNQLFCKHCHCKIPSLIRNGGSVDKLCKSCFQERVRLSQHKPHPHANSVRVLAQRTYPTRELCRVKGCNKLGIRHHEDYDKPLDILWLCHRHHRLLHIDKLTLDGCAILI